MVEASSLFVLGSFVVACSARVARFPRPGESLRAEAFALEAGGKGFNLALGASRLGAPVDGLFAVGSDPFADFAAAAFARAGLPIGMLRRRDGATGAGIGFVDEGGENCLAVDPGANLRLSAGDVRAAGEAIGRAALVLAQFEIGDEPIAEAFSIARAAGRPTLLNPSPCREPDPAVLGRTSILVLNRVEAAQLAGLDGGGGGGTAEADAARAERAAADLLRRGPDAVVVTLGAEGALACRRDGPTLRVPARPVRAVDTLGAGDAFAAGLAVGLAERRPWTDAMRLAAACGAAAVRRRGVFDALPTRAEAEALLVGPTP
jgi:ribokinase